MSVPHSFLVLRRLVWRLERAGIPYAVTGAMAVYAHGRQRTTNDVQILLSGSGLQAFRRLFVPRSYEPDPARSRRFVDKKDKVTVEVLQTGHFPGRCGRGPISFPDPEAVRERIAGIEYVDLVTLIPLKLAARRYQESADVVRLIAALDLKESFAERLHPTLRADYFGCLEEKRRDDEFEARA